MDCWQMCSMDVRTWKFYSQDRRTWHLDSWELNCIKNVRTWQLSSGDLSWTRDVESLPLERSARTWELEVLTFLLQLSSQHDILVNDWRQWHHQSFTNMSRFSRIQLLPCFSKHPRWCSKQDLHSHLNTIELTTIMHHHHLCCSQRVEVTS